jgi:hypothetical protein
MPSDCQCSSNVERVVIKMPEKEAKKKIDSLERELRKLQEENNALKRLLKDYLNTTTDKER